MEMLRTAVRSAILIVVAALFIVQEVLYPLQTVFIPIGEYFHCMSYVFLAELLWVNRGLRGISVKTQMLFYFVHWLRYMDALFHHHHSQYIRILKLWYMAASLLVLVGILFLRSTYEVEKDTGSLLVLTTTSVVLGTINFLIVKHSSKVVRYDHFDYAWIVSHYLQGFAMLPQFIFCYRDPDNDDKLLLAYILSLGGYRVMYAFNWIQRLHDENFFYVSGPLGLAILLVFLSDFLLFKLRKHSCISDLVLRLDDTLDEMEQPLMNAIYSINYTRLPAGSSSSSTNIFSHQGRHVQPASADSPFSRADDRAARGPFRITTPGLPPPPRLEPVEISLHSLEGISSSSGHPRGDRDDRDDDEGHRRGMLGGRADVERGRPGGSNSSRYDFDEDDDAFYDEYESRLTTNTKTKKGSTRGGMLLSGSTGNSRLTGGGYAALQDDTDDEDVRAAAKAHASRKASRSARAAATPTQAADLLGEEGGGGGGLTAGTLDSNSLAPQPNGIEMPGNNDHLSG